MERSGVSTMLVVALFLALMTATAFGQQADKGAGGNGDGQKQKPKYHINVEPKNRAAVDALMAESLEVGGVEMGNNGKTIRNLAGRFRIDKSKPVEEAALDFIDRHREAFGFNNPKVELRLDKKMEHKEGDAHVYFQQTYHGVPIWQKIVNIHVANSRDIDRISSGTVPTPDIDTTPAITADQAIIIVKNDMNIAAGGQAVFSRIAPPKVQLVIYAIGNKLILAYQVRLSASRPSGAWYYHVDAKTGHIISKENRRQSDGLVSGSGKLWNGASVNIGLYDHDGQIYLADGSKPMGNASGGDFVSTGSTLDQYATLQNFKTNGTISAWDANDLLGGFMTTFMKDPNNDKKIDETERLPSGVINPATM